MSVMIVGPTHIDALLTFAIDHGVTFEAGEPRKPVTVTLAIATAIGRAMLRENAAAYAVRYPLEAPDTSAESYRFARWRGAKLQPAEIRGGCACLEYQCNELARWYRMDAKRALDAIGAAAHALCPPGEKSTAWELDDSQRPAPSQGGPRGNATVRKPSGPRPVAPAGVLDTVGAR